MAVKERKQITGTTAQIDAYAGHEGQLLWDKEKKTIVGMSGTAGTNYPMASESHTHGVGDVTGLQAALDGKQPKGSYATTTALTEGLNKKENAGVCLPLTGGTLTGNIAISIGGGESLLNRIGRGDPYAGIELASEADYAQGAVLSLRGLTSTKESGSFHLRTAKGAKGALFLRGDMDGSLTWKGSGEILRTSGDPLLQRVTLGASGAKYVAPFTGWLTVAGGTTAKSGNIEIYNEDTEVTYSASMTEKKGWMRCSLFVRKGDTISIIYYDFDKANSYINWAEG